MLKQTASQTCVICDAANDLQRLSLACRVNVFIEGNIFVPENVRSCRHHLDANGYFLNILVADLGYINRPIIIRGPQMFAFFNQFRHIAAAKAKFIDENSLSDEEFQCIALITKQQFHDLLTYCDPVLQNGRPIYK